MGGADRPKGESRLRHPRVGRGCGRLPLAPEAPLVADPLPSTPRALLILGAFALLAAGAPLASYTVSLALFGGAHILTELRYVEARFGRGPLLRAPLLLGLGLGGVALLRALKATGLWSDVTVPELLLVALLSALALPTLREAGPRALVVGLGVTGGLLVALALDPIVLLFVLAAAHNWTPLGFLAEALPRPHRRRALGLGLIAFVALPLLLLTGLPGALVGGSPAAALSWPSAGPLSAQLGAYLPRAQHGADWATAAFSALTYAQLVHYAVVIGVLPRLAPGGPAAPSVIGLSRLSTHTFVGLVTLLSLVGAVGYALDFSQARLWYGVVAAVHAWIELPALLVALAPALSRRAAAPAQS